jgi:hypothetical protein
MAYTRIKNIKGNDYLYIQESYRENGNVKTRHLGYLGRAGIPLGTTRIRNKDKETNKRLEQNAIKKFGTTTDPNETGYLLSNGKRLDFSGKKEGGQAGMRSLDHREISNIYWKDDMEKLTPNEEKEIKNSRYGYVESFSTRTGAIRYDITGNILSLDLNSIPTKEQKEVIRKDFIEAKKENPQTIIYVDVTPRKEKGEAGHESRSFEYKSFREFDNAFPSI